MDFSLPGSSVHGIFQARVLEWGAIAFSVMEYYSTIKKEQNNAICSNMKAAKDYYFDGYTHLFALVLTPTETLAQISLILGLLASEFQTYPVQLDRTT